MPGAPGLRHPDGHNCESPLQRVVAALLLLTVTSVLAACGGDDSGSGANPSGDAAPGDATLPAEQQAYFLAMATAIGDTHTEAETIRAALQEGLAPANGEDRGAPPSANTRPPI